MANHESHMPVAAEAVARPTAPPCRADPLLGGNAYDVMILAQSIIEQATRDIEILRADGTSSDDIAIVKALESAIAFAEEIKGDALKKKPISPQKTAELHACKGMVQAIAHRLDQHDDESAKRRREAALEPATVSDPRNANPITVVFHKMLPKPADAIVVPSVVLTIIPMPLVPAPLAAPSKSWGRETVAAINEALSDAGLRFEAAVETAKREGKVVAEHYGDGASALWNDQRNEARDAARAVGDDTARIWENIGASPDVAAAAGVVAKEVLDTGATIIQKTHTVKNKWSSMDWGDALSRNWNHLSDGAMGTLGYSAFTNQLTPLLEGLNNDGEHDWAKLQSENGERLLDVDGDGKISMGELRKVLVNNRVTLDKLDADRSGSITLGELTAQLTMIKNKNKARVRGVN
jgi:hypothetical protein